MSELIGKGYNPYGMASGSDGLLRGLQTGIALKKQRGLASGFSNYLNATDDSGRNEALQQMAEADPEATMGFINKKKKKAHKDDITPYQQAMLALKAKEIEAQQNSGSNLNPYEKTLMMEEAKNRAEIQQKANALEAGLPAFEEMANQLNEVGKDSTYTLAGQGYDWALRNLGLGATKGAEARERYRQIVNNELLPKLRETFGGQLSDAERESLLSTLGNVDLSPKERQQAVASFIESKKRQLEGYKRQLGVSTQKENKSTKDDPLGIL